MKPTRTWIVIANGARARILLNNGPGKTPTRRRASAGPTVRAGFSIRTGPGVTPSMTAMRDERPSGVSLAIWWACCSTISITRRSTG